MSSGTTTARRLERVSERSYRVMDGDTCKGIVWHPANDARWRASDATGLAEWRPWAFYTTPQEAARACTTAYDRARRSAAHDASQVLV